MVDIADLLKMPNDPERVVVDLLHRVDDPEIGVNVVDLGLLRGIRVEPGGNVQITMTLTTPTCPLGPFITQEIESVLGEAEWVRDVEVNYELRPAWDPQRDMSDAAKQQLGWLR